METGIKVRFKHVTYCPQAEAQGIEACGEVTHLYERDGILYANVLFPGVEYNWIKVAHLTEYDDATIYDPLPPPEPNKQTWLSKLASLFKGA
jgi:hypothetical protein